MHLSWDYDYWVSLVGEVVPIVPPPMCTHYVLPSVITTVLGAVDVGGIMSLPNCSLFAPAGVKFISGLYPCVFPGQRMQFEKSYNSLNRMPKWLRMPFMGRRLLVLHHC